jgi:fructose-bisphosphate aldolase class I
MTTPALQATVAALLAPHKGLLAADESTPTLGRRFAALGIGSTPESRRDYRALLFAAPGLAEHVSGAILYDETLRQGVGGVPMQAVLAARGILAGIKVDRGTDTLPGSPTETFTQGLDGLRARLAEYAGMGARFTKWRAVFRMGAGLPGSACVEDNANALALFAALSQEAGLVPVVEPEVLMDGDHGIAQCEDVMGRVLNAVFARLIRHRVCLEAMLLKTGMVLPGSDCHEHPSPAEVAEATLRCLRRSVPVAVPGIVFLSGGQSEVAATERLNALCRSKEGPWILSFSFGRALQATAMRAWGGAEANTAAAQAALRHRARCNGLALAGAYTRETELGDVNTAAGAAP